MPSRTRLKSLAFIKGILFLVKPHIYLGWLKNPFLTVSNLLNLTRWIDSQKRGGILNDFYSSKRDYSKRYILYETIVNSLNLKSESFDYIEFGVSSGNSFKWWVNNCTNLESRFYGFDTFEGLPENWGSYKRGDMSAEIPIIEDNRIEFIKGLFQVSLPLFLQQNKLINRKRKIIHFDADLFSSTLYSLTSMYPYLKSGDILLFDEFAVPNHEFFAFKLFSDSFGLKTKFLGAVNNYLQVALIIE